MSVVAEGIESLEQVEHLRRLGCALGQGFLYARPMDPDTMRAFLADRLGAAQSG